MSEKDIFGIEKPPYIKRLEAEQRFQDGDPKAIDACLIACQEDGAPIPNWAFEELVRAARLNLGPENALPRKPGRPVTYEDKLNRKALCCAVLGARKYGIRKEASYEKAHELLQMVMGIPYELESIKILFQRHGSEYLQSEEAIEQFKAMLHLFEEGLLDEYTAENKMNKRDIT